MPFNATVLARSVSPDGYEICTFEATYPRIVHSELMTHRDFSRNSASTRAIPLSNQLKNLLENPFIPEKFGINQPGMQAYNHLAGLKHDRAVELWLRGRDRAVTTVIELILGTELAEQILHYKSDREFVPAKVLLEKFDQIMAEVPKSTDEIDYDTTNVLNVHKQLAGRGLEAYMWHTVVITSTEFANFYALRDHPEAQGEIATIARLMRKAHSAATPRVLNYGDWHTPYVQPDEFEDVFDAIRASAARAAAASYNRQHAKKSPEEEFARYDSLRTGGHMSPLEHQATPFSERELRARKAAKKASQLIIKELYTEDGATDSAELTGPLLATERLLFSGNLRGFTQHRKQIPGEHNFGELRAA